MIYLDKTSIEWLHAFLPYCSIAVRTASRDFTEGEVKDFSQEWSLREESPYYLL
jgi:hypothetical protein